MKNKSIHSLKALAYKYYTGDGKIEISVLFYVNDADVEKALIEYKDFAEKLSVYENAREAVRLKINTTHPLITEEQLLAVLTEEQKKLRDELSEALKLERESNYNLNLCCSWGANYDTVLKSWSKKQCLVYLKIQDIRCKYNEKMQKQREAAKRKLVPMFDLKQYNPLIVKVYRKLHRLPSAFVISLPVY